MSEGMALPTDSRDRKNRPMVGGLLDYFPSALAEVAYVSFVGNEKHNPGEPLHHARGKSMDHADCLIRHLADRGKIDTVVLKDGRVFKVRHTAYVAWRALALLQEELEADGAPLARAARLVEAPPKPLEWLPWVGNVDLPVATDPRVRVRVRLRNGVEDEGPASSFDWGFADAPYDIVMYAFVS